MSNALKAAHEIVKARTEWLHRLGKTFGGKRDLYETLGYQRNVHFQDFWERYLRGGIAGRIVDAMPQATWRNRPKITSEDERFNEAWTRLANRLNVFHMLERADRVSGIGHYGVLFIGTRGANEDRPIRQVRNEEDVVLLRPFTEANADIHKLVQEPSNPRFGLPEVYSLEPGTTKDGVTITRRTVHAHHSRVIHIAEGLLEDEIFGVPRLQRVWNYLQDLDKVVGGTSEAVWRTVDRGIQFDVDKDAELKPEDEQKLEDELEAYVHDWKRYIQTQGVKANVLGSDVPDPSNTFDMLISLISGSTGIPQRVLLGSERGQLASNQDERNFNARVKERQQSFAEPLILRPFINRLISIGALPEVEYQVQWPDLGTQTRREQADVAARVAQGLANWSKQPGVEVPVLDAEEFRRLLSFEPAPLAEGPEDPLTGGNS